MRDRELGHDLFRVTDRLASLLDRHYGIIPLDDGPDCGYRHRSKGGDSVYAYPTITRSAELHSYTSVRTMAWEHFLDWLPRDARALLLAHQALYGSYWLANRVL